ncbi:M23 family metallopeptidase [Aquimarina spongiae]|uniref:Peptidase family M23 n=1 Tax=Aquimarina spongiae TaxID=570521 RepID=A0A1M6B5K9_9FLAO|nr:M23 family metallopeptidase [Aquimarina spongiae]SHI44032.1 Peptidase family M23 [Aquimarina spongiae]
MKFLKLLTYTLFVVLIVSPISCADTLIGDEGALDEDVYLNYQTLTTLELPFEEEWFAVNAGRTHGDGAHHFVSRSERYAYDLLIVQNRRSYSGDGSKNEDYFCFGKRLNAPGDGKVVAIESSVEDNEPGTVNRTQVGNYVIIDHLNGETSILAHLKKGSIIVAVGDMVTRGQEIGQAGNSGASTEPHLHYHLQQTSEPLREGLGLPAQFLNYYEDDVFVERSEPVKGQRVRKN